ncbi:hypothetical protein Tco_0519443 [Tanacetum coccineum]
MPKSMLCQAVVKEVWRDAATKKRLEASSKQLYENFTASSTKILMEQEVQKDNKPSKHKTHKTNPLCPQTAPSITNGAVNTAHSATTASTQATVVTPPQLTTLVICRCAFFAKTKQTVHNLTMRLLQQIHPDI